MKQVMEYAVSIRVDNGTLVNLFGTVEVDAYEKVTLSVPANGEVATKLAPAGDILLLAIQPEIHSAALTYEASTGKAIALDKDQFLFGAAVGLVENAASLTFTNGGTDDAKLTLLIGRNVTVED